MSPSQLLQGLNEQQREAVATTAAPLCILAGAGSGKTRVLTRRIAYRSATGTADPRRVLALTFTRKAATEMRGRLRQLGMRDNVNAGTFHGIAYAQLRSWWGDRGAKPPELLDRKVGFVGRLIPRAMESVTPFDIIVEIEWAKARLITPETYAAEVDRFDRKTPVSAARVADLFARYEEEKQRRNLVDFDDLLGLCARALRHDREFGAAQRWRANHLFVDEFQDVNPLQFRLLTEWLGDSADLCVVGDPNQAIYAWNGADASYLTDFRRHFRSATTIELRQNYRSTPQILAVANTVLGTGRGLIPNVADGPLPKIRSYPSDVAEAEGIARNARDARPPGGRWADQAVLVRTNAQLTTIEKAFRAAKIPVHTRSGAGLLEQDAVKRALRTMARTPSLDVAIADLQQVVSEISEESASVEDALKTANLEALIQLGTEFRIIDPQGGPAAFEAWLRATVGNEANTYGDAVDLATFHAAKGLEWPVVHIGGMERGLVPIGHAKDQSSRAEERRLAYVALTRAEQELHLSWAAERTFGTRTAERYASPYLEDVELALQALAEGRSPNDLVQRVSAERAKLREKRAGEASAAQRKKKPGEDPVLDALKAWRLRTARAANVPAFVVFSDKTLEAVAEAKPTTHKALLKISGIGPVKVTRYGDDLLEVLTGL